MVEHAQKLGIDPDRIAVGGDSAGAGMAAGMVLHNRDAKGPAIALQLLIYPMLDNLHNTPSGSIEDYPVWNRQTSFNAWEMYLGGKNRVLQPLHMRRQQGQKTLAVYRRHS